MKVEIINGQNKHCYQADENSNLMEFLISAGILMNSDCAGRGTCGKCKVKILSGQLSPATETERKHLSERELGTGWVMSCQRVIKGDLIVEIPRIEDAVTRKIELQDVYGEGFLDPNVEKYFVSLKQPDLADQLPDLERLLNEVGAEKKVSRYLLNRLPEILRKSNFFVTAVLVNNNLIDVEIGDTREKKYGFVFDIGTTTIAVYLVDLYSGKVISANAETNPQQSFGADVVARITEVSNNFTSLSKLQSLVLKAMSKLMKKLLAQYHIEEQNVYHTVVVGNTTMSHLFLEADPRNLVKAPFIPCYKGQMVVKGKELGLPMHPEGDILVLPNIAGYVGSDTMGVMLATRIYEQEGYSLAVDIGTNGEIVLAGNGRILTCSTAAGPAFEGAQIQNGMRAGTGAIEKVHIIDGEVHLNVIGDTPPIGICGSGIIDAIAELFKAGLINSMGRLADVNKCKTPIEENLKKRLRKIDNMCEFVLAFKGELGNEHEIIISQKDIRELQLAKGAIAAGIKVLAETMEITTEEINQVFLAGAFGNYINQSNAVALGMFPGITVDKIKSVGNAAGEGARMALLSKSQRDLADKLSNEVYHIELSSSDSFYEKFMAEVNFPRKEEGKK